MARCQNSKCKRTSKSGQAYCTPCAVELGGNKSRDRSQQCKAITKMGSQCKNNVSRKSSDFCPVHSKKSNGQKKKTKKKYTPKYSYASSAIHYTQQGDRFTWKDKSGYKRYLKTDHWQTVRNYMLLKDKMCRYCGTDKRLQVHHIHYNTVWEEREIDLTVFCEDCHYTLHGIENDIPEIRNISHSNIDGLGCQKVEFYITLPTNDTGNNALFRELFTLNDNFFSGDYMKYYQEAEENGDLRAIIYLNRLASAHYHPSNYDSISTCAQCGCLIYLTRYDEELPDNQQICFDCAGVPVLLEQTS